MRASRRRSGGDVLPCARRWCIGVAVASLLAACGGSPDPKQTIQTLESWSGTLELARAEHHARAVGDSYARQLLDAAREARDDARQSLSSQDIAAPDRDRLDAAFARLDADRRRLAAELRQP